MIIQMTVQMSGARYDDRQWPRPWSDFEVPDEEGRGLVRCGAAMEVVSDGSAPTDTESAAETAADVPSTPSSLTQEEIAAAQAQQAAKTQPSPSDPKAAWVEHAVAQGADPAEAEGMTKVQLQQEYGGRM